MLLTRFLQSSFCYLQHINKVLEACENRSFSYFHVIYRILPCYFHGFYSLPFAIYNIFTGILERAKSFRYRISTLFTRYFHVIQGDFIFFLLLLTIYLQIFGSLREASILVFQWYLQDIFMQFTCRPCKYVVNNKGRPKKSCELHGLCKISIRFSISMLFPCYLLAFRLTFSLIYKFFSCYLQNMFSVNRLKTLHDISVIMVKL